jgi:hypothetical protein
MSGFLRVALMTAKTDNLSVFAKAVNEADTKRFSAALAGNGHADDNSISANESDDRSIFEKITDWHFEGRQERNNNLPTYNEADADPGWRLLEPEQSIFHDNGIGEKELKFINDDGREVVFDGDTHEIILDPELLGTYNYVNPAPMPEKWNDIGGLANWAYKGIGHTFADVIPYAIGGNVRGPDDAFKNAFADQYDYDIDLGGGFDTVGDICFDSDLGTCFDTAGDTCFDSDLGGGF